MANSDNIDAAFLARLSSDATLSALAPGGIYRDIAPQGVAEPYGVFWIASNEDEYAISDDDVDPAFESVLYGLKFVKEGTSASEVKSCSARAHVLLQRKHKLIAITGYNCTECAREERIAYVEVDEESDRRFQHRGGYYRVKAEPI